MSQLFPLQPLLDLSKDRLDDATRDLGQRVAREQEGTRKLEMLQSYRNEYETRFRDAVRDGIGVEAWRNYSAFMARIDEAIAAQRAQVEASQRHTAAGKQVWVQQRNRVKAFDTLQHRHRTSEERKLAKAEQRLSDEHTANRQRLADETDAV